MRPRNSWVAATKVQRDAGSLEAAKCWRESISLGPRRAQDGSKADAPAPRQRGRAVVPVDASASSTAAKRDGAGPRLLSLDCSRAVTLRNARDTRQKDK